VHGFSEECFQIEEDLIREFLTETAKRGIYSQFTPLSAGPKLVREQP